MMAENQHAASGSPPEFDKGDFNTEESEVEGLAVVAVSGSVDMLTAPGLAEAIDSALAKKPKGLIIDLLKVEFLGSAGISVLMKTRDNLGESIQTHCAEPALANLRGHRRCLHEPAASLGEFAPMHGPVAEDELGLGDLTSSAEPTE